MANYMHNLRDTGSWAQRLTALDCAGQPCLFLDRDGVIVEETHYLSHPTDVSMIAGIGPAIAEVNRRGIPVVIVTNQAGIGRGYYDWNDFAAVQGTILDRLAEHDAHTDAVLACAYHQEGIGPYQVADHSWRKPAHGMLVEAAGMLGVDLTGSFMLGDAVTDLQAAQRAGLKRAGLVRTGHGARDEVEHAAVISKWTEASGFWVKVYADAPAGIAEWLASDFKADG